MRPVRLEVEGFTTFRAPTVVDFAGADLFALVGPTGAGKTSVIDAMTFALYGCVPRLDDRRAVAPVVSQNLNEARLRLDFTVDGVEYTAARVIRRTKTSASTKEARLERGGEVLAGTADEVTAAVTDLLGLSFEHFTTCVSLPQGQFARFLHDKPASRQDLLVRLLSLELYGQVGALARDRGKQAGARADVIGGQLEHLADATPAALDAARQRVSALVALGQRLEEDKPALDALAAAAIETEAQADDLAGQVALLDGLAAPDGVGELAAALAEADAARQEAAKLDEEAAGAVADAESRLRALPDRALLDVLLSDHRRRGELVALRKKGEATATGAAARLAAAVEAEATARTTQQEAQAGLDHVRVELRAQALVPELVVGEPCPVCRQDVAALPGGQHPPDLARAEREVKATAAALAEAADELSQARTEHARVDTKLAGVRDELAEVESRLADASTRLRRALSADDTGATGGDGSVVDLDLVEDQAVLVGEAEVGLEQARRTEREAHRAWARADRRHRDLQDGEREARRSFDVARDAVASLSPPAAERHDLAADWAALLAWAGGRRPELDAACAEQRQAAAGHRSEAQDLLARVVAACEEAEVNVRPRVWPGQAVAGAQAGAEAAVDTIEQRMAEAERLRADERSATEERRVAEALGRHLEAGRFEKWLLDEALHQLVSGASVILDDLSSGAYALAVDGRGGFSVIDHTNASQARPARTLSGGETFLASLALALALADQVTGLAARTARLEALFLDEGFGTLDPEMLDVVASALDELGARGRMVGVVTHVRELADRLPVRFEVRKVGGVATVERVDL